jgi:hypothetical protein
MFQSGATDYISMVEYTNGLLALFSLGSIAPSILIKAYISSESETRVPRVYFKSGKYIINLLLIHESTCRHQNNLFHSKIII